MADVEVGMVLAETVLELHARDVRFHQIDGSELPESGEAFLDASRYLFISSREGKIELMFHMGSDAVSVARRGEASLTADYLIF